MAEAPLRTSTGGKSPMLTSLSVIAAPRLMNQFAVFHSLMAPKGATVKQLFESLHRRTASLAEDDSDSWITRQSFESVFFLICVEAICTDSRECWAVVMLLIEIYDESFATILAHAKVFAENRVERGEPGRASQAFTSTMTFGEAAHLLMYWPAVQKKLGSRTTVGTTRVEAGMSWGALARAFVGAYPLESHGPLAERVVRRYCCMLLSVWFTHLRTQGNEQVIAAGVVPFMKLWTGSGVMTPMRKLLVFVPPMLASIPVNSNYQFLYSVLRLKDTLNATKTDASIEPGAPLPHVAPLMEAVAYRLAAVAILADRGLKNNFYGGTSVLDLVQATWSSVGALTPPLRASNETPRPAAPKRQRVRRVADPAPEGQPAAKRPRRQPKKADPAPPAEARAQVPAAETISEVLAEESNPAYAFAEIDRQTAAFGDAAVSALDQMDMGRLDDYPDDI